MWRARWTEAEAAAAAAHFNCDERAAEATRLRDSLEARERELSQCKAVLEKTEAQASVYRNITLIFAMWSSG